MGKKKIQRVHKEILTNLKCSTTPSTVSTWCEKLPQIEHDYNLKVHSAIKMSPAKYFLGFEPRSKTSALLNQPNTEEIRRNIRIFNSIQDRAIAIREEARLNSAVSALRDIREFERRHPPAPKFKKHDHVLCHFKQRDSKLISPYRGPYVVVGMANRNPNYYVIGTKLAKFDEEPADKHIVDKVEVHAARLLYYDHSRSSITEELQRMEGVEYGVPVEVIDHQYQDGRYQVKVRWDKTNEISFAYLPDLVKLKLFQDYVKESNNLSLEALKKQARKEELEDLADNDDVGVNNEDDEEMEATNKSKKK